MQESLIIIPTYNEIENIETIIRKVFSLYADGHILVVDDGSPDGTAEMVKQLQNEFSDRLFIEERKGKLGLGTAYIHGFKYALQKKYQYIFEMDADFSHNPASLIELYKGCAIQNADMTIGSRYKNGVNVVNWPMSRVLLSYFAGIYVKFITGMPIHDATAGFVCYTRKALESIDLDKVKFIGYAFQIEMKFSLWKSGFNLLEIPIVFTDRTKGTSKMSPKIVKEALLGVLSLKVKSLLKHPGEALSD